MNRSGSIILIPKVVVWPERFSRRPYILKHDPYYGPLSLTASTSEGYVGMIIFWVSHQHTGIYLKDYLDEAQ